MEKGQPVWLKSSSSQWGWVPALVHNREEVTIKGITVLKVTLRDDPSAGLNGGGAGGGNNGNGAGGGNGGSHASPFYDDNAHRSHEISGGDGYYADIEPFEITLTIDIESAERDELEDIKIRDIEPTSSNATSVVGGVNDLIGLTHLHEPAILHALRLRYDSDIIYTSTGPILIAINPFKSMPLYTDEVMEKYRMQGEMAHVDLSSSASAAAGGGSGSPTTKGKKSENMESVRLPPHAYLTADDAYRAMMRGIEMNLASSTSAGRRELATAAKSQRNKNKGLGEDFETPMNQSILVSGESGAGKTVTTKIVLNYFAMLSEVADKKAGIVSCFIFYK